MAESFLEQGQNIEINPEFERAFELIESGNGHVFVTGKAGTGKSTLLRYVRARTKKNTVVLAPTGLAAINVQAQTIHSFFKLPPRFIDKSVIRKLRKRTMLKNIEMLIIDEISMVRADLMDGIDHALRINRGFDIPFGGVQIVMFGDLFQLPPVVRGGELKEFFRNHYGSPYFFDAHVFKDISFKYLELEKVYRQTDAEFIGLLERIRHKHVDQNDLELLNHRVCARRRPDALTLTSTNELADRENQYRLDQLKNPQTHFTAEVSDGFSNAEFPADFDLRLKVGAQVMMLMNDAHGRWVNGTLGVVHELGEDSVKVMIDGFAYEVPRTTWSKIEYKYDKENDKIYEDVIGDFEQFPIKLAWAMTIHKSQGKTFENVIIDIGNGAFTHGQVYVALSRCTTLEGIVLKKPIRRQDIIFDRHIHAFRERMI